MSGVQIRLAAKPDEPTTLVVHVDKAGAAACGTRADPWEGNPMMFVPVPDEPNCGRNGCTR